MATLSCWLALLLLATQLPQKHAPLTVADGLGRSDMHVVAALGLDRLAGSGLLWLVVAFTAVVWFARLLFPLALVRLGGDAGTPTKRWGAEGVGRSAACGPQLHQGACSASQQHGVRSDRRGGC